MMGDRTKTDAEAGKTQLGGAGGNGSPAAGNADHRDDANSAPSMAELARRLAERTARQHAVDPAAAAAARRAALEAYDLARERRLIVVLSAVLALTVGAAVAYFVSTIESRPSSQLPIAAAQPDAEPAPSREIASAAMAPVLPDPSPPPPSASPPPSVGDATEPAATQAPLVTDSQPAPVEARPSESPLQSNDVREIQAKLRSFGFNPGPVDGTAGRLTEVAVRRYQQARGQPQTGEIDRRLLEQLRQDPAPPVAQQVAQRGPRPDTRASRSPGPRRSDPFEPVRSAGNRVGQWLDSLAR
jgi:Putative peptidoglycan binding domain